MSKADICSLLGIRYPIFQGGMAWISDGRLAAAVSNGGGLGIISAMNADSKYLSEQINIARELTDKPFGVNVMLMSPHIEEVAELLYKERVPVITTGAGNPSRFIPMWNSAGIKVIPVVASVAVAKLVTRAGAAAVIAEGGESGGHVGEISTLALIPQVSDATPLPVIAAGGIADGRGVAACFMLGAQGVQLGTRFLVSHECSVHSNYKQRIIKAKDIDTITTGKRLGHPVRSLKTQFSREYFKREYDSTISDEELEKMAVGALRLAAVEGDEKRGCFLAGQSSGLIKKEQSAAEIIEEIFNEAKVVLGSADNILNGALRWVK